MGKRHRYIGMRSRYRAHSLQGHMAGAHAVRGRQRGVMVSQGVARKRKAVRAVAVTTPDGPNSPKPKPSDKTSRKKDAIVLRLTLLPIGGRPPGAAEGLSARTGGEKACARGWVDGCAGAAAGSEGVRLQRGEAVQCLAC